MQKIYLIENSSSIRNLLESAYRQAGFAVVDCIDDADIVVINDRSPQMKDQNLFGLPEVKTAIIKGKEAIRMSDGIPYTWTCRSFPDDENPIVKDFSFETKLYVDYDSWEISPSRATYMIDSPRDKYDFLPDKAEVFMNDQADALDYTNCTYIKGGPDRCCYVRWKNLYF